MDGISFKMIHKWMVFCLKAQLPSCVLFGIHVVFCILKRISIFNYKKQTTSSRCSERKNFDRIWNKYFIHFDQQTFH